jgi:ABC-type sugar transport system permease subunit
MTTAQTGSFMNPDPAGSPQLPPDLPFYVPVNLRKARSEFSQLFFMKSRSHAPYRRRLKDLLVTSAFLLPSFVVYSGFIVLPVLFGLVYSFTSWNGFNEILAFIGLDNFRRVFSDFRFFSALRHTVIITVVESFLLCIASLLLALLIDTWRRHRRVRGAMIGLFVFPFFLGTVMVTAIWRYILDFRYGFINSALRGLGLERMAVDWLGNPKVVLFTNAGVEAWSSIGIYILFYLTALQAIPSSLDETAVIDGAGLARRFTFVMMPYLLWAFMINLVIILSKGLSSFETVLLLTQGGPGFASETISYYIYWSGFLGSRQGYGSAISIILFVVTSGISLLLVVNLRKTAIEYTE